MRRRPWLLLTLLAACGGDTRGGEDGGAPRDAWVVDAAADATAADAGAWMCVDDAECDDGVVCTIDSCDTGACAAEPCVGCCPEGRECVVGAGCVTPAPACEENTDCDDDVRCTLDACRDGFCDHQPEPGLCGADELCLADRGCVPDRPSCVVADDCEMGRPCDGSWSCEPEFGCQYEGPTDCDDGDPCTADACDETLGCTHEPIDTDSDGSVCGVDCDDEDGARFPGAAETCNEIDDDCDESVDEALTCTVRDCGAGDTWQAMTTVGAPSARNWHRAAWTGTEMMVWGGISSLGRESTGGLYDPSTDTWRATPTTGAPGGRIDHVMVWTGTEVLVWGGRNTGALRDGAALNPSTMTWRPISTVDAPPATSEPNGVWTGTEMVVWGDDTVEGGRYDPMLDTWTPMTTTGAPSPRDGYVITHAGSEIFVWGGRACGGGSCPYVNSGGRYDLSSNTWSPTTLTGAPVGTYWASGVWTGTEHVVFGGRTCGTSSCPDDAGGRYDPLLDRWRPLSDVGRPTARFDHAGHWTGSRMLVWGGVPTSSPNGAIYDPASDTWTAMSTAGQPAGRYLFSSVWTGTEMIVWGGLNDGGVERSGGVYCPASG